MSSSPVQSPVHMCPEQDVHAVLCCPVLQAQRLAAIDALLKNGAGAGAAGSGDLEVKLRRLATDVRQLKDRMGELLGGAAAGQQVRSGPRNTFSENFCKGFSPVFCFAVDLQCLNIAGCGAMMGVQSCLGLFGKCICC